MASDPVDGDTEWTYPQQSAVLGLSVFFLVLVTAVTALRFLSRRLQRGPLLIDDWLALLSGLAVVGLAAVLIAASTRRAIFYQPPLNTAFDWSAGITTAQLPDFALRQQLRDVFQWIQILALGATKLSVLFLYRRLLFERGSFISRVNIAIAAIVVLWTVTFLLASIFRCGSDFSALWGLSSTPQTCAEATPLNIALTASNLALYLPVALVPIPCIWALKTSWARVLGICALYLLAGVAICAAVVRTIGAAEAVAWDFGWSLLEAAVAAMTGCLPALQAFASWISCVGDRGKKRRSSAWSALMRDQTKEQAAATGSAMREFSVDSEAAAGWQATTPAPPMQSLFDLPNGTQQQGSLASVRQPAGNSQRNPSLASTHQSPTQAQRNASVGSDSEMQQMTIAEMPADVPPLPIQTSSQLLQHISGQHSRKASQNTTAQSSPARPSPIWEPSPVTSVGHPHAPTPVGSVLELEGSPVVTRLPEWMPSPLEPRRPSNTFQRTRGLQNQVPAQAQGQSKVTTAPYQPSSLRTVRTPLHIQVPEHPQTSVPERLLSQLPQTPRRLQQQASSASRHDSVQPSAAASRASSTREVSLRQQQRKQAQYQIPPSPARSLPPERHIAQQMMQHSRVQQRYTMRPLPPLPGAEPSPVAPSPATTEPARTRPRQSSVRDLHTARRLADVTWFDSRGSWSSGELVAGHEGAKAQQRPIGTNWI